MTLKKTLTLLIAVLALSVNQLSARDVEKGEWSVRLILTSDSEELEDSYNRLGQLHDALPGADIYDLPELDQTWAGTYLSVIFYRPEWGVEKVTYNTDFHPRITKTRDEWRFEVRSDDPYRDLSLTWASKKTKMKHMVLVDLQEGVTVRAAVDAVPQVYNFRMNGPVREFAWRVLKKREYERLFASGDVEVDAIDVDPPMFSDGVAAPTELSARSMAADEPAAATMMKSSSKGQASGWQPKGWGQGEGKGYRRQPVPDGLPDDPFGD